uniref:Uncharacterized protein n=1 Tax=Anguilla anguilla TaxID=7936 RepID=A0A0E9R3J5_ANGAN
MHLHKCHIVSRQIFILLTAVLCGPVQNIHIRMSILCSYL